MTPRIGEKTGVGMVTIEPAQNVGFFACNLSVELSLWIQESGLKVNQPASFAVSLNGAKGVIDAKVHSPSGALEECVVTEIDEGNGTTAPMHISRVDGIRKSH